MTFKIFFLHLLYKVAWTCWTGKQQKNCRALTRQWSPPASSFSNPKNDDDVICESYSAKMERERDCVCACVCVCERERERARDKERLCVWEKERLCVCRERVRVCVCVCEREYTCALQTSYLQLRLEIWVFTLVLLRIFET